ncbi:MAG TPA: ABC transporter permease [Actinoplanes sp.]|jgi:ABC-type transport system involved in multi-copper enzyme maturation permease subunit|nr:ABC transporter permease [Actinoplanes sp.]
MIWLTWRQFRAQSIVAAVTLVAAVVLLAITGFTFARMWTDSGAASCPASGDCSALQNFVSQAEHGWTVVAYTFGAALIYLVPPLVGVFWGAPLVARELETGTQRLVWTQSVTRARWLAVKLAVLGAVSMAFAGLLSLAATWSSQRLDGAGFSRLAPMLFGARGIVPVAYAAFAFVLGVTVGMVIRRTVPAMATTLAVYAGCAVTMALGVRSHLLPAKHVLLPLDLDKPTQFGISTGGHVFIVAQADIPGAWILQNQTVTPAGQVFNGPADPSVCGPAAPPKTCLDWVGTQNLRQSLVYQPAERFWALQWLEAGVFLALTALLVAFGFWWLRRRSG